MSAKNPAEQIKIASFDSTWPRQRALLLLWLGMKNIPVLDFGPVEGTEIKIGDLSPKSTEFPDFNAFFKRS